MSNDAATSTAPTSVTIVEDDQSVREMLAAVLSHEGYTVTSHDTGTAALADPTTRVADVIVLDIGLPDIDGLEICGQLRSGGHIGPILMLTARHTVGDRVAGLDAGADDYLVKPFALDELLARVRAMARRTVTMTAHDTERLSLGDVDLDLGMRTVSRAGVPVDLTKYEFDLLRLLVANAPMVLSRDVLYERVWGYDQENASNSLEVFVSQLRKKLEADGGERIIHTVRGVGYTARLS
ncbi:MAG: response regulator transcription factor [Actinomycetota bacterium]